jgi:hypothetical protein
MNWNGNRSDCQLTTEVLPELGECNSKSPNVTEVLTIEVMEECVTSHNIPFQPS